MRKFNLCYSNIDDFQKLKKALCVGKIQIDFNSYIKVITNNTSFLIFHFQNLYNIFVQIKIKEINMKKTALCLSIALFLSNAILSYSQSWVDLFNNRNANFYDIQKAFNKYWAGKTHQRGQGWMVFKRWEYDMEPRVYPTGKLPDPAITYKEIHKYRQDHGDRVNDLADWTPMGPYSWLSISYNPGIGRINCITQFEKSPGTMFAGSPSGGMWRSSTAGQTWESATDNLEVLGITSIQINQSNTNIMYIATGDGDGGDCYSIGVLKTTNGGMNWNTTGLSYQVTDGQRIYALVMSPADPNILLAGTNSGIYRTTDGAATWTQINTLRVRAIEYHPINSSIIYATGSQFFYSTDAGVSFNAGSTGLPTSGVYRYAIGVSPAGPNYVYLLACNNTDYGFYGFYKSTDAGMSFVNTITTPNILGYEPDGSSSGGQGFYDLALAVSPLNVNEVYTGGVNIWKSTDGGASFVCNAYWVWPPDIYGYVHADIHTLKFIGKTLYTGTDGGLFKTTNFGVNWIDITEGMSTTQFYRFGGTPQNPDFLVGGTQDNGSNRYDGVWTHILGADGMEAAVNPTNQNTIYCSIYSGNISRSYNEGVDLTPIRNNITGSGGWVTPFVLDPVTPTTIYAGYQDIWKSTNEGDFWKQLSTFNGGTFVCIAVAKSNKNYIYANTIDKVYMSSNDGGSWNDITTGLPNDAYTYLDVSSTDPAKVWVTLSGYTAGQKVYQSTDAGMSWTNFSGTLPNIPANCITYLDPNRLFVGTDAGVFYRDNTMSDWAAFMTNLPNVRVNELELNLPANKIRAATYGRGIWESPIPDMVGIASNNNGVPKKFALYQNYPNPFNPTTVISFDVATRTNVSLRIFNILGQEIRTLVDAQLSPGHDVITWDGKNNAGVSVNSGIYIYSLQAGDFRDSKKLALVK